MEPNQPVESTTNENPRLSGSIQTSTPLLKKTSPLKQVSPIIKKYDCQRQAKNGKCIKSKAQGQITEENRTPVQDLAAGMNSLDAALRQAEKCIASSSKDHESFAEFPLEGGVESIGDDLGDVEEDGVSSTTVALNQQNAASIRTGQLRSRSRVVKKRNQLQKDLENALPLAATDEQLLSEERSIVLSNAFFMKVKERYEVLNPEVFLKFLELMNAFGENIHSFTDFYHRIIDLFKDSPDLCEEFLLFLQPAQAIQCGKFMEHLALTEMSSFLRKLELYFAKQPQQLKKILSSFARLVESENLTLEIVRNTILPLLKGNTFLYDSFVELLPAGQPSESKMTDFDQLICDDLDSEHSGEEETFERVEVPLENDDRFSGENCQCCCHKSNDSAYMNRNKHCVTCGIKFISGKVFMQTEHGLRPVRIEFNGNGTLSSNIKRLNANRQKLSRSRTRRGGANTPQMSVKPEECKPSAETDDEAACSSKRSPRQRPKIPKTTREKPVSARSLSLNRKPAGGKLSPSPLHVTPPGSAEEKHQDQNQEQISQIKNEDDSHSVKNDSEHDYVDHEDGSIERTELQETMKENSNCNDSSDEGRDIGNKSTDSDNRDGEIDTINGECIQEDISMEELDVKEDENSEDSHGEGPVDVSGVSSDCDMENSSEDNEGPSWTREEDRVILFTFQSEPDRDKTLIKIKAQLPHRTKDEISSRFHLLMNLIQKMR